MSDLIDRQATIDTLDKHLRTTDVPVSYPGIISALTEWLNELPSAQADSKELSGTHKALDTVSRQAVIEAINKIFPADPMHDDYTQGITCGAALANIYVAQLPPAQPEPHWIPCSERLPERNLVVLVTTKWGEVTEGVKLSGNAWFIGRGEENAFDSDIIAWMPKPEPYKEGGAV